MLGRRVPHPDQGMGLQASILPPDQTPSEFQALIESASSQPSRVQRNRDDQVMGRGGAKFQRAAEQAMQYLAKPEMGLKLETQHQSLETTLVRPIEEDALPGRRSDATIQAQRRGVRGNTNDQSATKAKPLGSLRQVDSAGDACTAKSDRIVASSGYSVIIRHRKDSADRAPSSQPRKVGSKKVRGASTTLDIKTPKRIQPKFCLIKFAHASRPAATNSSSA